MAEENDLPWRTIGDLTAAAKAFLDAVLAADGADALTFWSPTTWKWT
jgi:hypothetical protein